MIKTAIYSLEICPRAGKYSYRKGGESMENEKILKGICCEVKNCVHNNGNCCCTADSIKVKNRMAVLGEETMCETFEEL